jgi:transcriptional regulator with XRE-family HTH domain
MPATVEGPRFAQLIERLLARLRGEIAAGGVTVRRLAREIGMSQPHMQNVVSGKRALSLELADKLLEYATESTLELATPGELGWALAWRKREREGLQLVSVATGRLGPAHPYPELRRVSDWIALPLYSLPAAARPVFVELNLDEETARLFPGGELALLDAGHGASAGSEHWCALRWSGGGWVRRVRLEEGRLLVSGQWTLRPEHGPPAELPNEPGATARLIWIGRDRRRAVPLEPEGYLNSPPAADS